VYGYFIGRDGGPDSDICKQEKKDTVNTRSKHTEGTGTNSESCCQLNK